MRPPVVILAGGLGTRLRPLTEVLPKPMVPLGGKPLIAHLVERFQEMGFHRVYIAANYKGALIKEYAETAGLPAEVRILDSKDTIDGVRLIAEELGDEVVVSMGDLVTSIDVGDQYKLHREAGADATVSLTSVDNPLQYGLVMVDESKRILLFTEKPVSLEVYLLSLAFYKTKGASSYSNLVNAGIYVLGDNAMKLIMANKSLLDFGRHLFPLMVEEGYRCYGYVTPPGVYWEDIGTIEKYKRAMWDVISGGVPGFKLNGETVSSGVHVHKTADVRGEILPPVYIGEGVVVEEGAVVGPYVSLEGGNFVGRGSRVENSILWRRAVVGRNTYVRESILLNDSVLSDGVKVVDSVIGSGNKVAEDVFSKVLPNKVV
mgnify:FL=1